MAIPKEPRQLMINIMYIVLTALLALNVSAEIFNAFKVVDKGLKESNKNIDESNARIPEALATAAKKDPEKFQTYVDRVPQTRTLSKDLSREIDEIMTYMIDETGNKNGTIDEGDYRDEYGSMELVGKKDKDITTRYLVESGKGEELKAKVMESRDKFLELIDEEDREAFAATMPLEIDDETWNKNKRSNRRGSWAEFNFKQMPLQAALPILNKMKNDVKNTEASILNYFFEKMGSSDFIVFDKFAVVSAPVKSYIIKGEPFETEVFLSATSKNISNMSISVRGRSLPVREGVAKFTETPNSTGLKKYTASASLLNPTTNKRETYTREFQYEVGERSATVSADKMNVFYIGVDNPISVSAAGISTNDLQVNGTGGGISLKPNGLGKYIVTVNKQGTADITLSGGGLQATKYEFRVKRIPDPVAKLSNKQSGGAIPNGVFKAQQGLLAMLDGFDFDARCQIKGYRLVKASKRDDPEFSVNGGAKFNAKSVTIARSVKPGDRVYFEEVKAQCPGDAAPRKINELVFNIQ